MCNHKYSKNWHRYGLNIDQCAYTQMYQHLKDEKNPKLQIIDFQAELPLDKNGMCLFHSYDLNWKRENEFTKKFKQLVELLDEYDTKQYYDFAEFVFVGDCKSKKNSEIFEFKLFETVFKKEAKFYGAVFIDSVEFNGVTFKTGVNFDDATFKKRLVMQKCILDSAGFQNTVFEKEAVFGNIYFSNSNTTFTGSVFYNSVRFWDSKFEGMTIFSGAIFNKSEGIDFAAIFRNIVFEHIAIFTDSTFYCPVEFREVAFYLNAEFTDISFMASKSTIRYSQSNTLFHDIDLKENGIILFESTDSQKKLFNETDVDFHFKEDIKGIIRFKNVNFNNISNKSREQLKRFEKAGNVEIGPGCIKYRFQTETKTIFVGKDNQCLILELTQTFTNYFTAKNGWNLGFEIMARESDRILFFYFTDEEITEDQFLERLKSTEKDLWNLIYQYPHSKELALKKKNVTHGFPQIPSENVLINAIDGLASLMSIFFRVAIRISLGKWKKKDTASLIHAIDFDNSAPAIHVDTLHQIITYKFNQTALLSLHTTQTMDIKQ